MAIVVAAPSQDLFSFVSGQLSGSFIAIQNPPVMARNVHCITYVIQQLPEDLRIGWSRRNP
jgi:hypothetical protein